MYYFEKKKKKTEKRLGADGLDFCSIYPWKKQKDDGVCLHLPEETNEHTN